MTFKDYCVAWTLGLLGLGVPAGFINWMTFGINPGAILAGVLLASFLGIVFGVWLLRNDDNTSEPHNCTICGFPTTDNGWHARNCSTMTGGRP